MSHHANAYTSTISLNLNLKSDDDDYNEELGLGNNTNGNAPGVLPSLWGIPLKYISLVTLAIQNSMLTIIMHYSRVSTPPSRAYSASTAVLMNELLKGLISLVFAFIRIEASSTPALPYTDISQTIQFSSTLTSSLWRPRTFVTRAKSLAMDVFSPDCWKLSIPAILYVIQNNLQYVAASNLEAATFQVSYQMKILTTAGFSVLLLRKKLASSQWVALLFLAIGVGVVQIQAGSTSRSSQMVSFDTYHLNAMKGFLAVAAACFTSGLAGVYFEMVLKNSQGDLWTRNVQLSMFSLLPALVPIIFDHVHSPSTALLARLFHNFGVWAWATVGIQVFGGLVTAMVIKYSDNILKGFATSLSIVISFLASVSLFDFQITLTFVLGSVIVLIATWLYNQQPKSKSTTLVPSKDTVSWTVNWNEKPRAELLYSRSPSIGSEHGGLTTLTSRSPSSSSISLSSISTPIHGLPSVLDPRNAEIKDKNNIFVR